jgi:amino-acid N-acetyltransferase
MSLVLIRKANMRDVAGIQLLVNAFAERGEMLPRALNAIYEGIRDFFVADQDGEVVGCCALHIVWGDLAEIKSLAVSESAQGKGIGRELMQACLEEAGKMGIDRVFALTYKPEFFEKAGFHGVDKGTLPHKIWSDCINCPKFPDCGEEAVVLDLKDSG